LKCLQKLFVKVWYNWKQISHWHLLISCCCFFWMKMMSEWPQGLKLVLVFTITLWSVILTDSVTIELLLILLINYNIIYTHTNHRKLNLQTRWNVTAIQSSCTLTLRHYVLCMVIRILSIPNGNGCVPC
jgi:hypothetical protein